MTPEGRAALAVALVPLVAAGCTPAEVGWLLDLRNRVRRSGLPPRLDGMPAAEAQRWRAGCGYLTRILPSLVYEEWGA